MAKPGLNQLREKGEEMLNRFVGSLLADERFVQAVQRAVAGALSAKGALDKSLRGALATMNLPSTADVEELRRRLDDLDRTMTELDEKLARLDARLSAEPAAKPRQRRAPQKKTGA